MDSSGRTTQRQYYVGRGRPNTNSAEHLGVSEKWEDRMEKKRELLLVSCKNKGGGKQETHTQHQVEECPWLRGSPLDWFTQSPDHAVIPHSADDNYRGPQSMGKRCRGQRVKRSGHCASSIKEKPIDWDPECRSRKLAWQRHLFLDLCPAGGGNLSPALCPLLDF